MIRLQLAMAIVIGGLLVLFVTDRAVVSLTPGFVAVASLALCGVARVVSGPMGAGR